MDVKSGIQQLAEEREKQTRLGYTTKEDAEHYKDGELLQLAASYLLSAMGLHGLVPYPFASKFDSTGRHSEEENLRCAGASIAAELDRREYLKATEAEPLKKENEDG